MWIAVALVFAAQIATLFWFGNPRPIRRNHPTAGARISLLTNAWGELLALQDPTLFALPHPDNFSGAAWLRNTNQEFQATNPSEPARPLLLSTEQLGATFTTFMQTNPVPRIQTEIAAGLRLVNLLGLGLPPRHSMVTVSTVRVGGNLVKRHLLEPPQLPPQASSDVLKNTEVQLFVDALGNTFSPVIVGKSGDDDADAVALNFVKNAKFEPLQANARGASSETLTFGKLIFEWQTIPRTQTNTPAVNQ
jgi:hypothetical protein